ncbi:MAG: ABC transporter ATP-binding protein [Bacillota bacterium]
MKIPLREYISLLSNYLRPQWRRAALLVTLILTSLGLQLVKPQILRTFIDTASGSRSGTNLGATALLFMVVAVISQAVTAYSRYVSEDVGWTATNLLRNDLASHCLGLDMSFHKAHTPGEMIERIDGDITKLSNFFSQMVVGILANVLLLGGVIILLFREDYRVGLAMTAFALISLVVLTYLRDIAVPYWTADRQHSGIFFGFLGEHLAGTEDIRANGAVGYVMHRFYARMREWLPAKRRAYLAGTSVWSATIVTFTLGNATAFGLSAYLWQRGLITIGTVYLIVNYTELLRRPIEQIRTQLQELQRASASITRISGLMKTASKVQDGAGSELPSGPLGVELRDLSFAYESDDTVLKDISFALEPGKVLGLLGRTGSGKTTLARLLLRLYDPGTGQLLLGGVDAKETKLNHLRQKVAMVTQDVQLFQASVRDNITFFDPSVSDDKVISVLHELGLGDWLQSLPQGLDTILGVGGANYSAGEAQLLAFARCFLIDPSVVILDEASSRLDPVTEQLIETAITKLLTNRTGIIIAHRLDTVARADDILILDQGRIVEHGERLKLLQQPGSRFSTLLQTGLKELLA